MKRRPGFWARLTASLFDSVIVGILFGFISLSLYGEFYKQELNLTDFLSLLYLVLVPVLWRGYVIGKRLLNIRIVKVSGKDVSLGTMLMRVLVGGLIYAVTFGIGLIISAFMVGIREDKRAIHDFVAGTYVEYE